MRHPARSSALALRSPCPLRLYVGFFVLLTNTACFTQQAQSPPAKPAPPPLEFLGEWGVKGNDPGQIFSPRNVATDFAGRVYIVNGHNTLDSIDKFDPRGVPLLSFGHQLFDNLSALAVDRGGAIYAANYTRKLVLVFYPDGTLLRIIRGGPRHLLQGPAFLAVDDSGNVFVGDRVSLRILKFDSKGRFLKAWGRKGLGGGEFMSIDGLAVGMNNSVFVADTAAFRFQRFSPDGHLEAVLPAKGSPGHLISSLDGLVVTDRFIISADPIGHHLNAWTLDGEFIHQEDLTKRLNAHGYFTPTCVALSPNGELFTLDHRRARVLRFRINF